MTPQLYFLLILLPAFGTELIVGTSVKICRRYSFSNRPSQDCSSLSLIHPPNLLPDVISLYLSNNNLTSIIQLPISYSTLLTLRMDRCGIEKISFQALSRLTNLKTLDLSHNRLRQIIFSKENAALIMLNLAYNKLRYLPELSHLISLRLLDLSHNQLISISPQYLPFNLESIRLTNNQLRHLSSWPFLTKLQEVDVSFNPLSCECSLWEFLRWAERLALFDSSVLTCRKPKSLRKTANKILCGPEIHSSLSIGGSFLSLGEPHRMCCVVLSSPPPSMRWEYKGKNITMGVTQRILPDSGRIYFCLEIPSVSLEDFGTYRCIAELEGRNTWKEFVVEKNKTPLVLNSARSIIFYCQFGIGLFFIIFFCASYCMFRRGRMMKISTGKELVFPAMIRVASPCEEINESSVLTCNEDWQRILIWKERMSCVRAPLAQFDPDTHIMDLIHTSV